MSVSESIKEYSYRKSIIESFLSHMQDSETVKIATCNYEFFEEEEEYKLKTKVDSYSKWGLLNLLQMIKFEIKFLDGSDSEVEADNHSLTEQ